MRFLATGDWHGDAVTSGIARFKDVEEAAFKTVDAATWAKVDLYVMLGDLCDPDSGSCVFRSVRLALAVANKLRVRGIRSLWIPGNHDVIEDGSGETTLGALHELGYQPGVSIYEHPTAFISDSLVVMVLPFPSRSKRYDPVATAKMHMSATSSSMPTLVVGHLQVKGALMGSESHEMARGQDLAFPHEEIMKHARGPVTMVNGHYHHAQTVNGIHMPGSLVRLRHDEEKNRPGYILAEV